MHTKLRTVRVATGKASEKRDMGNSCTRRMLALASACKVNDAQEACRKALIACAYSAHRQSVNNSIHINKNISKLFSFVVSFVLRLRFFAREISALDFFRLGLVVAIIKARYDLGTFTTAAAVATRVKTPPTIGRRRRRAGPTRVAAVEVYCSNLHSFFLCLCLYQMRAQAYVYKCVAVLASVTFQARTSWRWPEST